MISPHIQKILDIAKSAHVPDYLIPGPNEPRIEVGKLISHAAQYYEKARYAVDYKEEHLLRRTAIERILRRRLTSAYNIEKNGESLVHELIQAGYIPNGELPESIIGKIQNIIDKIVLLASLIRRNNPEEKRLDYERKLISLATSEIEDFLFPTPIDEATVDAYYNTIKNHVEINDSGLSVSELEIQIYLACRRGLLKNDDDTIFYRLWLMHYPQWSSINNDASDNTDDLSHIANEFIEVTELIQEQINHPLHQRLVPKLKNDSIYFSFIRIAIDEHKEHAGDLFAEEGSLTAELRRYIYETYKREDNKVRKSAWRAVIYILITKIILAFAIELPYDAIILKQVNHVALGINVVFHPLLLIAMTRSIHIPKDENTARIIEGVKNIIYNGGREPVRMKAKRSRGILTYIAFILYFALFLASFGFVIFMLRKIGFNIIGIGLFLLFLTFVSYFGLRIRFNARRWIVNTNDEKFLPFLWDLFTLPIITLGRWLSIKFESINIFVFILDFIIETPFKMVLHFLDQFSKFIKEKKDEFY